MNDSNIINFEDYIRSAKSVIENNSSDLVDNNKYPQDNPYRGKCYISSEAVFFKFKNDDVSLKAMNMIHEGESHWFLSSDQHGVIDLTVMQYEVTPDYSLAKGKGFLPTKAGISKRSLIFHKRVMAEYNRIKNMNVEDLKI